MAADAADLLSEIATIRTLKNDLQAQLSALDAEEKRKLEALNAVVGGAGPGVQAVDPGAADGSMVRAVSRIGSLARAAMQRRDCGMELLCALPSIALCM